MHPNHESEPVTSQNHPVLTRRQYPEIIRTHLYLECNAQTYAIPLLTLRI